MYYSKHFDKNSVVVKGSYKNEVIYLSFEDCDFEEVVKMQAGKEYDRDVVSDIMYDILIAFDSDDFEMVYHYEVVFCINHTDWVGCSGEWV